MTLLSSVSSSAESNRRAAAAALLASLAAATPAVRTSKVAIPTGDGSRGIESTRTYITARLIELGAVHSGARIVEILEPIVDAKDGDGGGINAWYAHSHNAWKMAESGVLERVGLHPDTGEVLYRLDPRLARKAVR